MEPARSAGSRPRRQPESTLVGLLYPAGQDYRIWITPATHAAITGTWLDLDRLPDQLRLSSAGTVRRLRGLAAIGWPLSALARRLGVSQQAHCTTPAMHHGVTAGKARPVLDLYRELQLTPRPSARTARHVAAVGWPPPLSWDEDSIDLPWARPSWLAATTGDTESPVPRSHIRWTRPEDDVVDQLVIDRALAGGPVPLTRREWLAALAAGARPRLV